MIKAKWSAFISLVIFPLNCLGLNLDTPNESQVKELFTPIDYYEEEELTRNNEHFLKRELYFSSRYRIVKINFSLLKQTSTEITITPFEDSPLTATRQKLTYHKARKLFNWVGRITKPNIDIEVPYSDEVNTISVIRLSIANQKISKDSNSGFSTVETSDGSEKIQTMSSNFKSAFYNATYSIMPLKHNPQYHLILEFDKDKVIHHGDDNVREKLKEYHEFLNKLGEAI